MAFREDINGLRAVAVVLVLLFHLGVPGFSGGFVGVDVFFVISGFLMTDIIIRRLDAGSFSIERFLYDRAIRILPALVALVIACAAFGFIFVEPVSLQRLAIEGVAAVSFVSNILFWTEGGYFDSGAGTKWFLHTWSLSVEWQFYLLYPVILLVAGRILGKRRRAALLVAGMLFSFGLSVAAGEHAAAKANSFGYYMLPTRAWEMLAGGLVALAPARAWSRKHEWLAAVGLALIVLSSLAFQEQTPWPSYWAAAPVTGAVLTIAFRPRNPLLSLPPMRLGGRISYSLYLWHWPLIVAAPLFLPETGFASLVVALASIGIACASYFFVEKPIQQMLKQPRRAPLRTIACLAICAAAVCGCGVLAFLDGVPSRVKGDPALYADARAAAAEMPVLRDGCGLYSPFRRDVAPCVVGRSAASGNVLVLGDSIAHQWFSRFQALEPTLNERSVSLLVRHGCPPMPGTNRTARGFHCSEFAENAFHEARDPRYGTVVLIAMWNAYFDVAEPELTLHAAEAVRRLRDEVQALVQAGKRVVVVTTTPYPDEDVTSVLRQRVFLGDPVDFNQGYDFEAIVARSEPVDAGLASLADVGAIVVAPAVLLCERGSCPLFDGEKPIYKDAAHMRASYAARAGGFLDFVLAD